MLGLLLKLDYLISLLYCRHLSDIRDDQIDEHIDEPMNDELGIDLSTIDPSCGTPGETQYNFSIPSTLAA